jgi:hypothetical protein
MLTARMTSIGTLRIGKAAGVSTPASVTLDSLALSIRTRWANYRQDGWLVKN